MVIKNEISLFQESLEAASGISELQTAVEHSLYAATWDDYNSLLEADFNALKEAYEDISTKDLNGQLMTSLQKKSTIIDVGFSGPLGVSSSYLVYYTVNIIDFQGSNSVRELENITIVASKLLEDSEAYFRLYDVQNKQIVAEAEITSLRPAYLDLGIPEYLPKNRAILECQLKVTNKQNKAMLYSIVGK
jgi:hypothetical protein